MTKSQDKSIYLPDGTYNQLKERLVDLIGDRFEVGGTDAATVVIEALGEIADIWPEGIKGDAEGFETTSDCNGMIPKVSNADHKLGLTK